MNLLHAKVRTVPPRWLHPSVVHGMCGLWFADVDVLLNLSLADALVRRRQRAAFGSIFTGAGAGWDAEAGWQNAAGPVLKFINILGSKCHFIQIG